MVPQRVEPQPGATQRFLDPRGGVRRTGDHHHQRKPARHLGRDRRPRHRDDLVARHGFLQDLARATQRSSLKALAHADDHRRRGQLLGQTRPDRGQVLGGHRTDAEVRTGEGALGIGFDHDRGVELEVGQARRAARGGQGGEVLGESPPQSDRVPPARGKRGEHQPELAVADDGDLSHDGTEGTPQDRTRGS